MKRSWAAACSVGVRWNSARRGSDRLQMATAWSRRRSIIGTQPAPISMAPPCSVGCRSSTPSSTSTDRNRSAEWYTTMKSFEPMISAPTICSAGGRPSFIHSSPMGSGPLPTCSTNGTPALGQPGPERVVVAVARRPAARRPGRQLHQPEAEVEGGVELGDAPLDVVDVAQGDAGQPSGRPTHHAAMARLWAR